MQNFNDNLSLIKNIQIPICLNFYNPASRSYRSIASRSLLLLGPCGPNAEFECWPKNKAGLTSGRPKHLGIELLLKNASSMTKMVIKFFAA